MNRKSRKIYTGMRSLAGKCRVALWLAVAFLFLIVLDLFVYGKSGIPEVVLLLISLALVSMLGVLILIRKSVTQLGLLVDETGRMIREETRGPVPVRTDLELKDLAEHVNALVEKMHATERDMREQSIQLITYARDVTRSYKMIKEEERLRNKLSRYVGKNLVDKLTHEKGGELFENEKKELTILFADIRSFTAMAERMSTEDLVSLLNAFFDVMADIIFENNGVLDKFVGDQVIAVFGLLATTSGAEHDAVKTAVDMQRATERLSASWKNQGKSPFAIGIGINTGNVLVGNVGSKSRMDYTVMGDCVNISAKLQQFAKGGEIIVGRKTYERVQDRYKADERIRVRIKDKSEPLECYRIPVLRDDDGSTTPQPMTIYEQDGGSAVQQKETP